MEELQTTGTALDKGAFNITENDLRREHKLPLRVTYDSEEVLLYVEKNSDMELVSGTLKGEDKNWVEEKVENPLAETPTVFHVT